MNIAWLKAGLAAQRAGSSANGAAAYGGISAKNFKKTSPAASNSGAFFMSIWRRGRGRQTTLMRLLKAVRWWV